MKPALILALLLAGAGSQTTAGTTDGRHNGRPALCRVSPWIGCLYQPQRNADRAWRATDRRTP